MRLTPQVVNGKARFDGRTLTDWVPDAVDRLVVAMNPRSIVLYGSVARGDDGPHSDIDLLVIVDDDRTRHELATTALRAVAGLDPEVDVVVVSQGSVESRRDVPGTIIRPALREGKVVYRRGDRADLPTADPLKRLHLIQERLDLQAALEASEAGTDIADLDAQFVAVAAVMRRRPRANRSGRRKPVELVSDHGERPGA
jgi:predicted nucleotidyltransferase